MSSNCANNFLDVRIDRSTFKEIKLAWDTVEDANHIFINIKLFPANLHYQFQLDGHELDFSFPCHGAFTQARVEVTAMAQREDTHSLRTVSTRSMVQCEDVSFGSMVSIRPMAQRKHVPSWRAVSTSAVLHIDLVYTKLELNTLQEKAADLIKTNNKGKTIITHAYRDKPRSYWDEIMTDKVLTAYTKDEHGDPASPLNGRLNGVFFNVNVERATGRPPCKSLFGDTRLTLPVSALFDDNSSLYFTDFYCISRAHYVTLVVTRKRSVEDRFCQSNLLELDIASNPFLQRVGDSVTVANAAPDVWIELFVAHDVHLIGVSYSLDTVKQMCTPAPPGRKKNASCKTCNL